MRYIALILLALTLAACGGNASTSSSTTGSPSAAAGSPSAAAGSPSAAPSPLDATTQREICTDLEAVVITGGTASAQPEEALYHITYAQVQAAVQAQCPTVSNKLTP